MGAVKQIDFRNRILEKSRVLGNSDRGLKNVVSDLLNAYGGTMDDLEKGTFLSRPTLYRLMTLTGAESGADYNPHSDTLERVLRFFGAEVHFTQVKISPRFMPKEKL